MAKRFLLWLASFRLRILLRTAFLFLMLAVLALAVTVLQEEKQRSYKNYQANLAKTKEQIVARLRHPSGQLALLNPSRGQGSSGRLSPLLLPFSAIDFDDQNKARNALEMADCLIRFSPHQSLCVAIGNNPWMGGFIYAAGTFASGALTPHDIGDKFLDGAHRLRISVDLRGQHLQWIAPFELLPPRRGAFEGVRGRFTGYVEQAGRDYTGHMPDKEFRGWVWQDAACLDTRREPENCDKRAFFSVRLPVETLIADLLADRQAPWPPADLDDIHVYLELLPPGDGPTLFNSSTPGAVFPFALRDLGDLLQPGETLRIFRGNDEREAALIRSKDEREVDEPMSPILTRLIQHLPVSDSEVGGTATAPVDFADDVTTFSTTFHIYLHGAPERVVNRTLAATATRLFWFVGAVMATIVLAWLVIEIGLVRRVAHLTRRARQFSLSARDPEAFLAVDFSDLKNSDEMGILANTLNQLLGRVKEDAARERIRVAQEKEQWHAVGHEIMSPLQSLLALHGTPDDPGFRYLARMKQALRVLYGAASPSEAFQSSTLALEMLDIDEFLINIADNAPHIGVDNVSYQPQGHAVPVKADEYSLEDVLGHVLKNADRHRTPGSAIELALNSRDASTSGTITIKIHNTGPAIADEWLEKIFEYGFSAHRDQTSEGHRGQGLFVAQTYMAKMGGTITVANEDGGVSFYLSLPRGDN
jgi:signal transduction histidine kinase